MVTLSEEERFALSGDAPPSLAMAMRVVVDAARLMGARRLIAISSAHIDGCIYHGDAGMHFAERLSGLGGRVAVPTTLNVGALDLIHPELVRWPTATRERAHRQMRAYIEMGCRETWTCAPYQAGHRPGVGEHVAWAESNAVAFVNSVLGARSNRNGDFLDICCALTSRAPLHGLHLDENRIARAVIDVSGLSAGLRDEDSFYPVLGALLGELMGDGVAVIQGLAPGLDEDRLKALGAGAASSGAVGLFHVAGVTPEAPTLEAACGGVPPAEHVHITAQMLRQTRDRLSTARGKALDCVALGSPHFSDEECRRLAALLAGRRSRVPIYICTGRDVLARLEREGLAAALRDCGVEFVVDTCVVVTPILAGRSGTLMTNSAKFAHYAPANTGYASVFGALEDCVHSALAGEVRREEAVWR